MANEQQTEIWLYTYENWGAKQADKYIDGLHEHLQQVSKDPSLLRNVPNDIIKGVKFFHYSRHYVFLQETAAHLSCQIQVLSILHDRMDISVRLREALGWLWQ